MHSMIHRWKYSLKRGNKGYLCSTSIDVGVMISKCTKWDLFMFLRSVDIRGHCSNVLTVNWSILLHAKNPEKNIQTKIFIQSSREIW